MYVRNHDHKRRSRDGCAPRITAPAHCIASLGSLKVQWFADSSMVGDCWCRRLDAAVLPPGIGGLLLVSVVQVKGDGPLVRRGNGKAVEFVAVIQL